MWRAKNKNETADEPEEVPGARVVEGFDEDDSLKVDWQALHEFPLRIIGLLRARKLPGLADESRR